jgi:hypothetical protein
MSTDDDHVCLACCSRLAAATMGHADPSLPSNRHRGQTCLIDITTAENEPVAARHPPNAIAREDGYRSWPQWARARRTSRPWPEDISSAIRGLAASSGESQARSRASWAGSHSPSHGTT